MSLAESLASAARINLGTVRHDGPREQVAALFALPFADLVFEVRYV